MSANVAPLNELVAGDGTRRALWVLLGAVGFLLLIACVNLTNLLLAKAAGRTSRDRDPCRAWREPPAHRRFAGGRIASLVVGGGSVGSAAVGVDARSVARQQCLGRSRGWNSRSRSIEGVIAFTTLIAVSTGILTGLMPGDSDLTRGSRAGDCVKGSAASPGHCVNNGCVPRWSARRSHLRSRCSSAPVCCSGRLHGAVGRDRGFRAERRVLVESESAAAVQRRGKESARSNFSSTSSRASAVFPPSYPSGSVSGRPWVPAAREWASWLQSVPIRLRFRGRAGG